MTTAYTATNIKTGSAERAKSMPQHVLTQIATQAVGTGFAAGDTIVGPKLPANSYLIDVYLSATDIDSGATCLLDVGISGTAQKFIVASTVGQAGGMVRATGAGTLGYTSTSDISILLTCNATANTAVAGTIIIGATYTMDP